MHARLARGLTALVLAIGALVGILVGAGSYARAQLTDSVRVSARNLFPGQRIVRVEPHGRPFLVALLGSHEVSSAYVDLDGPGGRRLAILERLNRDSGTVDSVLVFTHSVEPVPLEPVLTADNAFTSNGTTSLAGQPVTVSYTAAVTGHTLCVRPQSIKRTGASAKAGPAPADWSARLTPAPVPLPAITGLQVRGVSVGPDDLIVELRARRVDSAHRAGSGSEVGVGTGSGTAAGDRGTAAGSCREG